MMPTSPNSELGAAPAGPSLARKAANFGKALIAHAVAGFPAADEATIASRMATCHGCDLYAEGTCLHPGCGCVVDVKISWKDQACPIGKW